MESTWIPCEIIWNIYGKVWNPHGIHVESCGFHGGMMWNDVESYGIHVELCGIHVKLCEIHVQCHGFHSRCVWNPCGKLWIPW